MTRQLRRIVRKPHNGIVPVKTKEGVAEVIRVENTDIVVDQIGDIQKHLARLSMTRKDDTVRE